MEIAAIVVPPSGRFAAGWGLQRLWRHLAAGLQRDWIGAMVVPSTGRVAAGWDCSDCGAIYWQVCSGMGLQRLCPHLAAGLQREGDCSDCGAT